MRTIKAGFGAFVAMAPMAVAWAEPATVDVFASTRYSDNINKSQQNPQEDFEHRVGIGVNKATGPGTCEGLIRGDLAFLHYQRGTNNDRTSGTLDANGNCQPNSYFRWNARHTLRDVRSDTAAPDSPANREVRNVTSTGPTFIWPVTDLDTLTLDAQYQITRFQESTVDDSDRITLTSRWTRRWTQRLTGGLSASRSDIDMRRTEEELTRENASAFFNYRLVNGVLSGEIGQSWLTTEIGPFRQRTDAVTGNLRYSHEWEGGTNGFLEVRRALTDASTDIDIEIQGVEFTLTETTGVEVTNVSGGLNQVWTERTNSNFTLSYTEQDFIDSPVREERYRADHSLNRQITQLLSGSWNLGYRREDFGRDPTWVNTLSSSLRFDYQRTRDLSLNFGLGFETRDIEGGSGNEFDEHWISAGLRYNLR